MEEVVELVEVENAVAVHVVLVNQLVRRVDAEVLLRVVAVGRKDVHHSGTVHHTVASERLGGGGVNVAKYG